MATTYQRLLLYPLLWHIYLIGLQYYWSCYLNQMTNYGKKAEHCGGTSGKRCYPWETKTTYQENEISPYRQYEGVQKLLRLWDDIMT